MGGRRQYWGEAVNGWAVLGGGGSNVVMFVTTILQVHYYLKNLFDEAQHSRTTRANLKPILSAKTEPSKTPPYRDHKPDRVTFRWAL